MDRFGPALLSMLAHSFTSKPCPSLPLFTWRRGAGPNRKGPLTLIHFLATGLPHFLVIKPISAAQQQRNSGPNANNPVQLDNGYYSCGTFQISSFSVHGAYLSSLKRKSGENLLENIHLRPPPQSPL
ncbi:hypothetical protein Droror1_Dr00022661 [Drosera rotundifolia]